MEKKNIVFNHTLEQYNKKYYKHRKYLIRISKKDVEDFDKNFPTLDSKFLLSDRNWALIGDTYYEIPSKSIVYKLKNMNSVAKITLSILLGAGLASAITLPITLNNSNHSSGDVVIIDRKISMDPSIKNFECLATFIDGNLKIKFVSTDSKYIVNGILKVTIGDVQLDESKQEYVFDYDNNCIYIKKDIIESHKGDIVIKPTIEEYIDYSKYLEYEIDEYEEDVIRVKGKEEVTMPRVLKIPSKCKIDDKAYEINTIGSFYYSNFPEGAEVIFPSTITYVEGGAFDSKSGIKKITLNEGLVSIGDCGTFEDMDDLEEINMPSTIDKDNIGAGIFDGNKKLKTVVIDNQDIVDSEDDVEYLYRYAHTVYIKDTLNDPSGESNYLLNHKFTKVTSDRENYSKWISNAEYVYEKLSESPKTCRLMFSRHPLEYEKTIAIPDTLDGYTVTNVDDFGELEFDEVTLSSNITRIENNTFNRSKIGKITLNEGLTQIGYNAFGYATVGEITIPSTLQTTSPSIDNYSFAFSKVDSIIVDSQYFALAGDNCTNLFGEWSFWQQKDVARDTNIYIKSTLTQPSTDNNYIFKYFENKGAAAEKPGYNLWTKKPEQ